jgi:hypothetical protein
LKLYGKICDKTSLLVCVLDEKKNGLYPLASLQKAIILNPFYAVEVHKSVSHLWQKTACPLKGLFSYTPFPMAGFKLILYTSPLVSATTFLVTFTTGPIHPLHMLTLKMEAACSSKTLISTSVNPNSYHCKNFQHMQN